MRDRLFLLTPDFVDPALPGRRFFCPHCALLEGVMVSFPDLATRVKVVRVGFPRPRAAVVALVGAENQSLPLLVLGPDAPSHLATGAWGDVRFASGGMAILRALGERHGIPGPHP